MFHISFHFKFLYRFSVFKITRVDLKRYRNNLIKGIL